MADIEEPPTPTRTATCRIEDCENQDKPIEVPDNGAPTTCGGCLMLIHDVTPGVNDPEPEPPEQPVEPAPEPEQ